MKRGLGSINSILIAVLAACLVESSGFSSESCPAFYEILGTSEQQFKKVAEAFERTKLIRFYDGRANMPITQLEAGKSYTVVVHDEKLIIGKDTPAYNTNKIGARGSHITLIGLETKMDVNPAYIGNSGAIKVHSNGMIDISGYHHQKISQDAADKIAKMIRTIIQDAIIRVTADRLSTLDEVKELSK